MNSSNPFAPGVKKYRISYQGRIWFADKVDWNSASGVLTLDGVARMIYHPKRLEILRTDEVIH